METVSYVTRIDVFTTSIALLKVIKQTDKLVTVEPTPVYGTLNANDKGRKTYPFDEVYPTIDVPHYDRMVAMLDIRQKDSLALTEKACLAMNLGLSKINATFRRNILASLPPV